MNRETKLADIPFNSVPIQIHQTNKPNYIPTSVTEHIFLNTDGFGLLLPTQSPLFFSLEPNDTNDEDKQGAIVISVQNRLPYKVKNDYPGLRFTIFSGANIRRVYDAMASVHVARPERIPDSRLFTHPIWTCTPNQWIKRSALKRFNQRSVIKFAKELKFHGFENGLILIECGWQHESNHLAFNKELFHDVQRLLRRLHRRGFRVGLSIEPNVAYRSVNFTNRKHLVKRGNNDDDDEPVLCEGHKFVPDFTNPETVRWVLDRIVKLEKSTKISLNCLYRKVKVTNNKKGKRRRHHRFDLFQFKPLLPFSDHFRFSCESAQRYPSLFARKWLDSMSSSNLSSSSSTAAVVAVEQIHYDAVQSQHLGAVVRISDRYANWSLDYCGLRSVIPTVLTLSLAGYSFVLPDVVGGRYGRPSGELYIRWAQATALMPAMAFAVPPWDYPQPIGADDDGVDVTQVIKALLNLRLILYSGVLLKLANRRLEHGEPMLRPLWYDFPHDANTYRICDQFMLGERLLVAPVLDEATRARDVYLPEGVWRDQHGTDHRGPAWLHQLKVPLQELPYFHRIDNSDYIVGENIQK